MKGSREELEELEELKVGDEVRIKLTPKEGRFYLNFHDKVGIIAKIEKQAKYPYEVELNGSEEAGILVKREEIFLAYMKNPNSNIKVKV